MFDLGQWWLMNVGRNYNYGYDILPADPNATLPSPSTATVSVTARVGTDINVLPVWEYTKGAGVKIGIIDCGVDVSHNDLKISSTTPGLNFVYDDNTPMDTDNHGTIAAGVAAATGSNNRGISGVAPESELVNMVVRGMPVDPNKTYNQMDVAYINAIEYAVNNNINIINASVEMWDWSSQSMLELRQSIVNASNVLFVVSTGNRNINLGNNTTFYPQTFATSNMIIVAAVDGDGKLSPFSNYGSTVHIAAPGSGITSTASGNSYQNYWWGTSFASPQVAGVAALLKAYYPNLTVSQIKSRIISPNNVTYNSNLTGKVTSNGVLNALYAFSNDSAHPRSLALPNPNEYNGELESNAKEIVSEIVGSLNMDNFTNKIFVNFKEGVNKTAVINSIAPSAIKLRDMSLTGSVLLEFATAEQAVGAVNAFNASENVNYAEPVYNRELSH